MLQVTVHGSRVRIGRHFSFTMQRTLRIPDDGGTYPLPPGLGQFPVRRVEDYADRVPAEWRERGGVIIPMYQREAMWLSFDVPHWHPCAVQVAVGKVNAISGRPWSRGLADGGRTDGPQGYVVCPEQPWLDGINAGDGFIRQFVAMPRRDSPGSTSTTKARATSPRRRCWPASSRSRSWTRRRASPPSRMTTRCR
jgi:hypothetical protein